jgi:regulator of protease activity HflC (stomatin/prohibitin superfamily)
LKKQPLLQSNLQQNLKERSLDVASQICITKDNTAVEVIGVLYLQVIDSQKASYGIDNYKLPDDGIIFFIEHRRRKKITILEIQ